MVDVLHHIPNVTLFFNEARRVLRNKGKIVMVEPWNSKWSYIIYKYFHHENFDPDIINWAFDSSGPLSGANGAVPWIVFERDLKIFRHKYPEFIVTKIYNYMFPDIVYTHLLYELIHYIVNLRRVNS